jgi:hypothetical protein
LFLASVFSAPSVVARAFYNINNLVLAGKLAEDLSWYGKFMSDLAGLRDINTQGN